MKKVDRRFTTPFGNWEVIHFNVDFCLIMKAVARQRERKWLEKKKPKKIVEQKTDDGEQENAVVQQDNKENQPKTRNRQYSRVYSLTTDNGRKAVCQRFFLSTVDIDEKRVCTALKTMSSDTGAVGPDGRGYHKKHHTVSDRENVVIEHISGFKTIESHYVSKTAKSQYLPQELTVKAMYRMYVDDQQGHERVEKYDFYKRVFNEKFNLKFQKNKKDRCDKCETFKNLPEIAKTPEMVDKHNEHARDLRKIMC